ncbi:MAG: hypothetical protein ACKOCB_01330 [Planctomycetia bacterium]
MRAGLAMRGLVAVALVGLVGGGSGGARAETVADAQRRHEALGSLVDKWIQLAERDPREDQVDEYAKYQEEDWGKRNRVKAEDLAKILADPEADRGLRQRAAGALSDAAVASRDPELAPDKRNDTTRRKTFAKRHLLDLIKRPDDKGGDQLGRQLAWDLLRRWYPVGGKDASDAASYDAASSKEDTWGPAYRAMREQLNK